MLQEYFVFSSPDKAQEALRRIPELCNPENSGFRQVCGWKTDSNPCCVEIDFFRHLSELPIVAATLGALSVSQDFYEVWRENGGWVT